MLDAKGVERQIINMEDPILGPGSSHVATVPVTVTPGNQASTIELYLTTDNGATKAVTTGPKSFTSTGSQQSVTMPTLAMPTTSAQYKVFCDVKMGGILIGAYVGSDDVIIPGATVGPITWS
jgi:hypothetical protein